MLRIDIPRMETNQTIAERLRGNLATRRLKAPANEAIEF
jgi:hypothetical protein